MEKQHFCIKTHNQEKKLALLTMVHSKNFTSSDFVSLKQDCGYIWKGKLEPWHIEGSFEENNKLIFFGPALDLEPLDLEYTADVKELKELSAFFNELKDMKHCRFTPKHFAKIRGGGFFLFPPKLMDEIIKLSPFGGYHEQIRY
jgi:hypothetical protein